jgi:bacteriorhodopsin
MEFWETILFCLLSFVFGAFYKRILYKIARFIRKENINMPVESESKTEAGEEEKFDFENADLKMVISFIHIH